MYVGESQLHYLESSEEITLFQTSNIGGIKANQLPTIWTTIPEFQSEYNDTIVKMRIVGSSNARNTGSRQVEKSVSVLISAFNNSNKPAGLKEKKK